MANAVARPALLRNAANGSQLSNASTEPSDTEDVSPVDDTLAICLFGVSASRAENSLQNDGQELIYAAEYEEEVRKRAVMQASHPIRGIAGTDEMQEVLPDAAMWAKWEATEAPLRRGRGWYPTLDRHFLELLVISEIACLSHPLSPPAGTGMGFNGIAPGLPGQAERVHRHAARVRRVACERIGTERLHAYVDRVREAFQAYVEGPWGPLSAGLGGGAGAGAGSVAVGRDAGPVGAITDGTEGQGQRQVRAQAGAGGGMVTDRVEEIEEDEDDESGSGSESEGESGTDTDSDGSEGEAVSSASEPDPGGAGEGAAAVQEAARAVRGRGRSVSRDSQASAAVRRDEGPGPGLRAAPSAVVPVTSLSEGRAAGESNEDHLSDVELEELMEVDNDELASPIDSSPPPDSPVSASSASTGAESATLVTPSSPAKPIGVSLVKGVIGDVEMTEGDLV